MSQEKRTGKPPIPDNLKEVLTPAQLATLDKMECFGWKLLFVRRPLFQDIVAIIKCPGDENCTTALLEEDGTLNKNHDIDIRE